MVCTHWFNNLFHTHSLHYFLLCKTLCDVLFYKNWSLVQTERGWDWYWVTPGHWHREAGPGLRGAMRTDFHQCRGPGLWPALAVGSSATGKLGIGGGQALHCQILTARNKAEGQENLNHDWFLLVRKVGLLGITSYFFSI